MSVEDKKDTMKIDVAEEKTAEMPGVEELLKILLDVNMEQNRQTVSLLMNYMNDIEENFYAVLEELDTVKEQLSHVQNTPQAKEVRSVLTDLSGRLQEKAAFSSGQIQEMRTNFNDKAVQLVQNFKEHGVSALNHVCEFLGVKEKLAQLHDSFIQTAQDMQDSIDKIDRVSQELRESSTHARNAGRALAGKEALEVPVQKETGFFHHMKRPYKSMQNFCLRKADKLEKDIAKLVLLEQMDGRSRQSNTKVPVEKYVKEKPAIMDKLETLKKAQGNQAKTAPAADKVKKQETVL